MIISCPSNLVSESIIHLQMSLVTLCIYTYLLYCTGVESNSNILDTADPDLNHYNDFDVNFMAYDIDSLKGNISKTDGFNLWHHNSRSILKEGRMDEYEILLESINNPFHIMGFSETWLKIDNVDRVGFQDFDHVYNIRPLYDDMLEKEARGVLSFFYKTWYKL